MELILNFLIVILCIFVMRKSSLTFDIASNFLTRSMGEGIKGPTINAIASSLPELMISSMFLFYFKDIEGFAGGIATIVGSSAFNIAIIPVVSFFSIYFIDQKIIFKLNKVIIKQDTIFLLSSILIMLISIILGVNIYLSITLISFYFFYIYFLVKNRTKIVVYEDSENIINNYKKTNCITSIYNLNFFNLFFKGQISKTSSICVLFSSVLIIGISCYYLVLATEKISHIFNINIFFGAFFIAAIASSIPDTILSIQDAKNKRFSDSFSNAYGSNVFDICIGIGLPVFFYSLIYGPIEVDVPVNRIGFLGNYFLDGNLIIWSLIVLFVFTLSVSYVFYTKSINIRSVIKVLCLYLIFIVALILF